jgi:hypothetical protein
VRPPPRAAAPGRPPFELLDASGGLFRLTRRSPTLDGAVPVRVAQACLPLLEGNAYGWQVTLTRPLRLARRLGSWRLARDEARARLEAQLRAALPRLVAAGHVPPDGGWARALGGSDGGGAPGALALPGWRRPRLSIWTGLLVRTAPGIWLRLTGAANRRSLLVEARPRLLADEARFVPLVLELELAPSGPDEIQLVGELACLAPVRPGLRVDEVPLAAAPEVGRAHLAFYDGAYFAEKRGGSTRKYRRLVGASAPGAARAARGVEAGGEAEVEAPVEGPAGGVARWVVAGPRAHELVLHREGITGAGPEARPLPLAPGAAGLTEVLFRSPIDFRFAFDGQTLSVEPDGAALARAGAEIERLWGAVYGPGFVAAHQGALLYLTKLFTPHPAGEPHVFVKPWALLETPSGWAALLDGVRGRGYDVLRGVVASDRFHAAPAVFEIHRIGSWIEVARGAPLLRILPVPAGLDRQAPRVTTLPAA